MRYIYRHHHRNRYDLVDPSDVADRRPAIWPVPKVNSWRSRVEREMMSMICSNRTRLKPFVPHRDRLNVTRLSSALEGNVASRKAWHTRHIRVHNL